MNGTRSATEHARKAWVFPDAGVPLARRLFDGSVLFVCATIFLRVIAVEPFGVPTGSMAPTFIGNHLEVRCPRCGIPIQVGEIEAQGEITCPNCQMRGISVAESPIVPGDRLLVDKFVFELRDPKRWETAVFLRDADRRTPYVKRVVGLPNERVQIRHGDVYINGSLARKSLSECLTVRVPIFEQDYVPEPNGWRSRWVRERPEGSSGGDCPFGLATLLGSVLTLDAGKLPDDHVQWITYRHTDLSDGQIQVVCPEPGYNQPRERVPGYRPLHEFMLECEFIPSEEARQVGFRLYDGADTITLLFDLEAGTVRLIRSPDEVLRMTVNLNLRPDRAHGLVLSFFDRRVIAALDGVELFAPVDLPVAGRFHAVTEPMQLGVAGGKVTVRHLRLSRDLYYSSAGHHATEKPYRLGDDEYFVLGDNSTNSEDSRWWEDPAVRRSRFLGKPFLLHHPSHIKDWTFLGQPCRSRIIDWDRIRWMR